MNCIARNTSYNLYYYSLLLFATIMFWGHAMVFIGLAACFISWLIDGHFAEKWQMLRTRREVQLIMVFFVVRLLGIAYSSHIDAAIGDIVQKLPYFIFALTLGTMPSLSKQQVTTLYKVLVVSLLCSTIFCLIYYCVVQPEYADVRKMSKFMSHIRLAMFVVMAIFLIIYRLYTQQLSVFQRTILGLMLLWFIAFLILMHSLTGLVMFTFLSSCIALYFIFRSKIKRTYKISIIASLLILIGGVVKLIYTEVNYFINPNEEYIEETHYTPSGNEYDHIDSRAIENGYYVANNVCDKELREGWYKLCNMDLDSIVDDNYPIRWTLLRYMTSRGLTKDKEGIEQLTPKECEAIKQGVANCRYLNPFSMSSRVYLTVWELYEYSLGTNPSGHSVAQRIEFMRCAIDIIKHHPWIGVGTGDRNFETQEHYESIGTQLLPEFRLIAHNQFVTFIEQYGFIGFIIIMSSIIILLYRIRKNLNILTILAIAIMFMASFNEDVIESQEGQLFLGLFVFVQIIGMSPKYYREELSVWSVNKIFRKE